jgi:hypothetical protein
MDGVHAIRTFPADLPGWMGIKQFTQLLTNKKIVVHDEDAYLRPVIRHLSITQLTSSDIMASESAL